MKGTLWTLFGVGAPSYFVLLLSGFILVTLIGTVWARRLGEEPDVIVDLSIAMLLSGLVGSRILHVFADGFFWDYVNLCVAPEKVDWKITADECRGANYDGIWDAAKSVCHPKASNCFAVFNTQGFAFYGGLLAAIPTGWWLLRRDRFPFWKAADLCGITSAIGLAFGRMGCLLAGCCFGVQSDGPMAMVFPPYSPASDWQWKHGLLAAKAMPSLPVLPTQILESAGSLAIGAALYLWVHPRKRYDGQVFATFLGAYAALRFVLEFFRSDDRGGVVGLSTSQLIGLALLAAALWLHRVRAKSSLLAPQPS